MSSTPLLVLPGNLTLGCCLEGADALSWHWGQQGDSVTVRSQGPISHAEPLPLAMLAAWADHQATKGVTVLVEDSVKSEYTWKYGLLSSLAGRPPPPVGPNARFVPPTRVRNVEERQSLLSQVGPRLGLEEESQRLALEECLSEMLRNVDEHADCERGGFVCASHFPSLDRVSVAIVDTGLGIPTTVRNKHGLELSDDRAVDAALTFGVTGSRARRPFGGSAGTVDNAGIGLYMVRSASTLTGGLFAIVSGEAFARSDRIDSTATGRATSPWTGTAVAVTFRPSRARAALEKRRTLMPKADRKREIVSWGPGPAGCVSVTIRPTVSHLAEDKDAARRVRDELLMPEVRARRPVCIDLREPKVATHTFIHALLYEVIGEAGREAMRLIHVHARERQIKDVVRLVAQYAVDDAAAAATSG